MESKMMTMQKDLIQAIEQLLQEKSFSDISVSALTQVSKISRMIFYRHYHNQIDVLNTQVEMMLMEFEQTIEFQNDRQYIEAVVLFFQRHSDLIKLLLRAQQTDILQQKISEVMGELTVKKTTLPQFTKQEVKYYIVYHTVGLMKVIIDWINHDQPETATDLAQFLLKNATAEIK